MLSSVSSGLRESIMKGALSFMLVDDNPDDRALVIRELSREFPAGQFTHVADFLQLTTALQRGPWSLVVTDYQLRWSDGLTVLTAVKNRWSDCPVIMFTGSGNEEIAVQAMKAGLDDYVLKLPRSYVRLAAAAHLALDRAEHRRRARDATLRYESLFHRVPVGLFCISPEGRVLDANPAMVELLGYPDQESLFGINAKTLVQDPWQRRQWFDGISRAGGVQQLELQLRRQDGRVIWAEINARSVLDLQGRPKFSEGSAEDITARKRGESRLRVLGEQWHALAAHLQSVRDQERNVLAREVRDHLEAVLARLRHRLAEAIQTLASRSPAAGLESLKSMPRAIDVVLGALRRIGADLRPAALEERGLGAALKDQIRGFERRTGIRCELEDRVRTLELDPERAVAVFRIVEEALAGIVGPDKPTRVNVHLREDGDKLVVEVRDNGRAPGKGPASGPQSLELLGMRERVIRLDGKIKLSRHGKGTFLDLRIPISPGAPQPKSTARN